MTFFKVHAPSELRGRTSLIGAIDDFAFWPADTNHLQEPQVSNEPKPRAWTADEIRDMLIEKFREIADYWATTDLKRPEFGDMTPEEEAKYRCHGVAFTMLSTLDGSSLDLPGFDLIPTPHPSDKKFHIEEGENWFSGKTRINTALHEFYHKRPKDA